MNRLLILAASLSLAACAAQSASPSHPIAPGEPPVATPPADDSAKPSDRVEDQADPPAPPAPSSDQVHVKAGGIPGGTPHIWGSRTIELRKVGSGWEVRLHDAESFQGVGMEPHQMPPTRHTCTTWERLPDDVAARAKVASLAAGTENPITAEDSVGVLLPWFTASAGPAPKRDPKQVTDVEWAHYFGRPTAGC